jgi:1,2-diacylglycerol 3-alpha-glucosyltransferase
MRVAIFTDSWSPRVDGLTTSVQAFMRHLGPRGHEFHVFCPGTDWSRTPTETRYKGVPFWGYPDFQLSFRQGPHDTAKILREGKFDLVHIQSPFLVGLIGLRAARKAGIPAMTSYHTYLPDLVPYVVPPGGRWLSKKLVWKSTGWFLRRCDRILTPSPSCAAELWSHLGDDLPPMEVHPNGVDTTRFHPRARNQAARAKLMPDGARLDDPVLVTVGRMAREKDIPFLLEALSQAKLRRPRLCLAIGGRGPELPRIRKRIAELGLEDSVKLLGFVPDDDLAGIYASADAFVTASQFETQGMTAVEAMASGIPVAAVHARGLADYVLHGRTGRLFSPGDVEEAAQAFIEAAEAPQRMRTDARAHAETLSLERSADQLEQVYLELAGIRPRQRSGLLTRLVSR